ncbi:MAG TPA: amino acid permease [archaeon]|nr:amino acid permease [archaeon]
MQSQKIGTGGHGFGTAPVFLASISTILGAILFLRFGYAVGHTGILGALMIVVIGHLITIPTAIAVAEIATNLKVEGGGAYYIISRSFGTTVGGSIGISLYFSQAISVAFYMIAFAEAFRPLFGWFQEFTGITPDIRLIGIPSTLILLLVIWLRGAHIGVNLLWVVAGILALSLGMFFLGKSAYSPAEINLLAKVENPDNFSKVFAIIFPAFTGMIAGIGLSGDLKNPRHSIPLGTITATLAGMIVYVFVILKLGLGATPEDLATDQFIMSRIALWGPIIPIGLAAATLSSAVGSILVAPRTLQALAYDKVFPTEKLNSYLGFGKGRVNEPVNSTLVTSIVVLLFVSLGSIDFVAQIISMFFMVTYGALCSISFLEHFAGNTSYRPSFRAKWYFSLLGAIASFVMMYQMQPLYASLAILAMVLIYLWLKRSHEGERDLSAVMKGVLFQLTRQLQILIQKKGTRMTMTNWRPSFIAISSHSLTRLAPFDILRWISHHYGFGSFIHFIKGPLNDQTHKEAKVLQARLIEQVRSSAAAIYVDTIISPSFKTAVAQIVQIPGISGLENNSILFEFLDDEKDNLVDIIDGTNFAAIAGFNICILRYSKRHFGYKKKIHIWLTPGEYRNANLMIILGYIIIGHSEWEGGEIELYAAFHQSVMEKEVGRLNELIAKGRIPISPKNVKQVPLTEDLEFDELVSQHSEKADLVITGFSLKKMRQDGGEFFKGFERIKDILFVRAGQEILIAEDLE